MNLLKCSSDFEFENEAPENRQTLLKEDLWKFKVREGFQRQIFNKSKVCGFKPKTPPFGRV